MDANEREWWAYRTETAHTGCPVRVNTSFNVRGEPIVCTPENGLIRQV